MLLYFFLNWDIPGDEAEVRHAPGQPVPVPPGPQGPAAAHHYRHIRLVAPELLGCCNQDSSIPWPS